MKTSERAIVTKLIDFREKIKSRISLSEYTTSILFALSTIVTHPVMMQRRAKKSYRQMKRSLTTVTERMRAKTIPRVALHATRVKSSQGRQKICTTVPMNMHAVPENH